MGKQVYFYMSKKDEEKFLEFVRSTGDILIIPQTSATKQLKAISNFCELEGYVFGEESHIWNQSISEKPVIKDYPSQGYYCIDFLESEVVNFSRSKSSSTGITMGRMHVEERKLTSADKMHKKSKEFIEWTNHLIKWIKKHYRKLEDGTYIGPDADTRQDIVLEGFKF